MSNNLFENNKEFFERIKTFSQKEELIIKKPINSKILNEKLENNGKGTEKKWRQVII